MVRIYFYSLTITTVGIYVPAVFLFTKKKDKNLSKRCQVYKNVYT